MPSIPNDQRPVVQTRPTVAQVSSRFCVASLPSLIEMTDSKVPAVAANVQILMRETLRRIGKVAGASAMPPKSALIQT